MANSGVRYIRKNGRVIPIKVGGSPRKAPKGGSIHLDQAVQGAATGATGLLGVNAANFGHKKTAIVFGAASAAIGLTSLYKNVKNSFEHGNKKKSFWHGVGRHITNNWASTAGYGAGLGAVVGLAKTAAIKKIR